MKKKYNWKLNFYADEPIPSNRNNTLISINVDEFSELLDVIHEYLVNGWFIKVAYANYIIDNKKVKSITLSKHLIDSFSSHIFSDNAL